MGLAIVGVLAVAVIPSMSGMLNKQTLKVKVSRLDTYVDQARNLAAITECPVQMRMQPAGSGMNIIISVVLDPFLKGCSAWYSDSSNQNNRQFSATIANVSLVNSVLLNFNAVSGVLNTQNQTNLTLNYRNRRALISFQGIGNGVAIYE